MYKKMLFVLPMLAFSFISASAADMDTEKMEVTVTATRVEKELQDIPYTVNVITSEDIRKSGATSLAELLRDIPSVELTTNAIIGMQRLSLRGENSFRTLIMVDGMKITEQKSMDGTPILVDINNIERIEVIKGPGSVLYGSEAIGGAINIITKKGGDKPIQGYVSGSYDTNSKGWSTAVALNGSLKNFYYRADFAKTDFDDRKDQRGHKLNNTDYDTKNYSLLAGYKNSHFDTGVQYTKYESTLGVYTDSADLGFPITAFSLNLPSWDREKTAGWFEYKNTGNVLKKARVDVYYQETYKDFLQLMTMKPSSMITVDRRMPTKNTLDTTGVISQFDFQLTSTNLLLTGFEFNNDKLDAKTRTITSTKNPMGTNVTETLLKAKAKQQTFAGFVHDEQALGDSFLLGLGVRYSKIKNELEKTTDASMPDKDTDFDSVVGSVSLVFTGVKDTAFRALYSSGYRAPNLQELYMGTTHGGNAITLSNPDLDPEKSNSYEAGVRYNTKITDIDFAVFYSDAKDYITTQKIAPTNGVPTSEFTNMDKAKTRGAELTAKAYVGSFTPYFSGSYIVRKYENAGKSTYKTNTPAFTGRAGVEHNARLTSKFTLNTDAYVRYSDKAEQLIRSSNTINKTDSYSTLNLALTGSYYYKAGNRLMLGVEALNLGNENYELAKVGVPEPGRQFIFKVSADF